MRLARKTHIETFLWYGTYVQKTCAYFCVEGKSVSGVKGHGCMYCGFYFCCFASVFLWLALLVLLALC